jgi:hypothetical protein
LYTKDIGQHTKLGLHVGDRVEVRSQNEILTTLDENGELDSLPFMPEMLQYCGQQMTVDKIAHKLCDTISGTGMRRMENAVHLVGARCDGSAHGGCQNACLIYWKEAWLKRVDRVPDEEQNQGESPTPRITLPLLQTKTHKEPLLDGEVRFSCQATELLRAAPERLPARDLGQYIVDLRSRNVGLLFLIRSFLVGLFNRLQDRSTRVLPRRLWFRGGKRWRFLAGRAVGRTPTMELGLRAGELVRIKSKDEILETLNKDLLNRGLGFDEEMSRHCGREARVVGRVDKVIDEKTGKMLQMKNSCIVLENVVCEGAYKANCPRSWVCFWREIWLDRVEESSVQYDSRTL